MEATYAVTFEFDNAPPLTERGVVEATSPRTLAARAIDEAKQKHPNRHWTSLVVVLERKAELNGEAGSQ